MTWPSTPRDYLKVNYNTTVKKTVLLHDIEQLLRPFVFAQKVSIMLIILKITLVPLIKRWYWCSFPKVYNVECRVKNKIKKIKKRRTKAKRNKQVNNKNKISALGEKPNIFITKKKIFKNSNENAQSWFLSGTIHWYVLVKKKTTLSP